MASSSPVRAGAVTSKGRPRGRPREFDRDRVLSKAAHIFWELGYEGASITDLTTAMGITPQSLYAAFHSKADLYHEALAQYLVGAGAFSTRALEEEPMTHAAFVRLLKEAAHEYARTDQPRGCMLSTGVITYAVENKAVARHVAALRAKVLEAFRARIERGKTDGDLRANVDSTAIARFLQAVVQGMSLQARDGASERELLKIVALASSELERHVVSRARGAGARAPI
jgi:AcrR family transcriptional regulator